LKVGDSAARVSRLYPRALFMKRQRAWWLVHVRERCIFCASNQKFHTVARDKARAADSMRTALGDGFGHLLAASS
jgi:hypothetical protein